MRPSFCVKIVALVSLFLAAPASAQSVKAGIDAWQRGDYVGAVAIWRPLAPTQDELATSGLAYLRGVTATLRP